MTFTILGAPRTKGNNPRLFARGSQIVRLPSKSYMVWFKCAMSQEPFVRRAAVEAGVKLPIRGPVNVTAVWYRKRAIGDEDNFKKGLGDFLQRVGVIENDKHIHWTGETRLDKDAAKPRTVVTIEALDERGHTREEARGREEVEVMTDSADVTLQFLEANPQQSDGQPVRIDLPAKMERYTCIVAIYGIDETEVRLRLEDYPKQAQQLDKVNEEQAEVARLLTEEARIKRRLSNIVGVGP